MSKMMDITNVPITRSCTVEFHTTDPARIAADEEVNTFYLVYNTRSASNYERMG